MVGELTSRIGGIDGGVVRVISTWVYRVVLMEAWNLLLNESRHSYLGWARVRDAFCFCFVCWGDDSAGSRLVRVWEEVV